MKQLDSVQFPHDWPFRIIPTDLDAIPSKYEEMIMKAMAQNPELAIAMSAGCPIKCDYKDGKLKISTRNKVGIAYLTNGQIVVKELVDGKIIDRP